MLSWRNKKNIKSCTFRMKKAPYWELLVCVRLNTMKSCLFKYTENLTTKK